MVERGGLRRQKALKAEGTECERMEVWKKQDVFKTRGMKLPQKGMNGDKILKDGWSQIMVFMSCKVFGI